MNSKSNEGRRAVLTMVHKAKKSHIGSNLSVIDILTALLSVNENDEVLMGKGWCAAAFLWYLSERGTIPKSDLDLFCVEGSGYIGLLEPDVKGVQFASGSVGMGLSWGVGRAIAKRLSEDDGKVFVIEGDGAMQTGMTWESAIVATHHKLDNLVLLVDENRLQAMGHTGEVLSNLDLQSKFCCFGWSAYTVDGHDVNAIKEVIDKHTGHLPLAIICRTVKGKGVSFMENRVEWHYKAPNDEEFAAAMTELTR